MKHILFYHYEDYQSLFNLLFFWYFFLQILTIQVHGDGAVSGQGVVMETFAMTRVPHYEIGGSLHLIVNNSLGFTAPTDIGRYGNEDRTVLE